MNKMSVAGLIKILSETPEDLKVEGELAVVYGKLGVEKGETNLTIYV